MPARTEQTGSLDTEVSAVRFAHGKRLEGLRQLGIFSLRDLLEHYPFRYDDFSKVVSIVNLKMGEKHPVLGTIREAKGRKTARGGFLYEVTITDNSGILKAIWFNQRWLADTMTVGKTVMLLGKVEHQGGYHHMSSPLYTLVAPEQLADDTKTLDKDITQVDSGPNPVGIVPVYRANSLISSNWIKRLVLESRKLLQEPLDPLPPALRVKRRLCSRQIAWNNIHSPSTSEDLAQAHRRLAYEQVFFAQLRFAFNDAQQLKGHTGFTHHITGELINRLEGLLPFALTLSQIKAVREIFADMAKPTRMNRLLLGDVGSGKTVVALHALLASAGAGRQSAMMAPTEVLAQQYAANLGPLLDSLGLSWVLMTSALTSNSRKEAYESLASGSTLVAFGTHALIEPDVTFKQLSLIIVDEQHRFGVDHRDRLIAKSPAADYLSMTATPIPRSLALVIYGNVTTSYLDSRPGKAKIQTTNLESSVAYKAYDAMRKALDRGEQAYIVCPFISAQAPIEEEENQLYLDDLEGFLDEPSIAAAEVELEHLRNKVFPERRVELLTSRVKTEEKQRIMADFKSGEVDILVSTTVIEVGIDVPNATVMLVLDANRFGLAQLHQLRGRIGRGIKDSQFFLIANRPGENARKRLRTLEEYSDGLKLAERDLQERREGDIAGTRQHGAGSLTLINVMRDRNMIEAAHIDVMEILERDPVLELPEHQHLCYELSLKESSVTN